MKEGTTVRWPYVLHPVSNITIWWPTSRGVKGDPGSASGFEVPEYKI
jgi:hypothetical protein